MLHHIEGDFCPLCDDKLKLVHEAMKEWFLWAKKIYPDLHIAWGWRGELDQHADFMAGRSKLDWPKSKHNNMIDGRAQSLALDVFQIDEKAIFNPKFYLELWQRTEQEGWPVLWGGTWKSFKDMDHFELREDLA